MSAARDRLAQSQLDVFASSRRRRWLPPNCMDHGRRALMPTARTPACSARAGRRRGHGRHADVRAVPARRRTSLAAFSRRDFFLHGSPSDQRMIISRRRYQDIGLAYFWSSSQWRSKAICCGVLQGLQQQVLHSPSTPEEQFRCGLKTPLPAGSILRGWLGSVLDSGAEGPGFKSQPRPCRVTVIGKLFTPVVLVFTKQRNW